MLNHEYFAEDFAKLRAKLKPIVKDEKQLQRILKPIHEFGRKYFQLAFDLAIIIQGLGSWELMKKRLRYTQDIGEKTDILENFISLSHICNNKECKVYNPIDKLNSALNHMIYTSLEEAEAAYGKETSDFKEFKRQYNELIDELTEVLKDTFILYTTKNTIRYERKFDQDIMQNLLLFSKESKESGQVSVSTVGPFEKILTETMKRCLPDYFKDNKKNKNEKLPKAETREKFKEIGRKNVERIEAQLGTDLEKIRRDNE